MIISHFTFVIFFGACTVHALDPLSILAGVSAAAFSAAIGGYQFMKCRMTECCDSRSIAFNQTGLENTLKSRLYGQHLVVRAVVNHLRAHLSSTNPAKALAFTFHGGTGTGKNYVSHMIVEHIYKTGMKSKYVHFISCDREFPHASRIEQYTDRLKNMIETGVAECERAIFIFDEIDKMPIGLLDVIKPYLEHYEALNGVTYRRAMFLFLTNTAGNDISKYTLEHWKAGGNREEIELKDLEAIIAKVALNTDMGLKHSELITKSLITAFIPFLPLERHHIRACVLDSIIVQGYARDKADVKSRLVDNIIDQLTFYPQNEQLFSTTGCKRVNEKVDYVMADLYR